MTPPVDMKLAGTRVHLTLTVPMATVPPGAILPVLQTLSEAVGANGAGELETQGKRIFCRAGCGATPLSILGGRRIGSTCKFPIFSGFFSMRIAAHSSPVTYAGEKSAKTPYFVEKNCLTALGAGPAAASWYQSPRSRPATSGSSSSSWPRRGRPRSGDGLPMCSGDWMRRICSKLSAISSG